MFQEKNGTLYYICDGEMVCIEAWGDSALRVRSTRNRKFTEHDWALDIPRGQEAHVVLQQFFYRRTEICFKRKTGNYIIFVMGKWFV